jgi:hypothetical protein
MTSSGWRDANHGDREGRAPRSMKFGGLGAALGEGVVTGLERKSFANLSTARFLHYLQLRVSPIRVCGLGGVRIALNDRTPFHFKQGRFNDLQPAGANAGRGRCAGGMPIRATKKPLRRSAAHEKNLNLRQRNAANRAIRWKKPRARREAGRLAGRGKRMITSDVRRPIWSSRTC